MKVRDAMTGDVLTMTPGRSLRDAAKFMADHNVGAVVIMDPEQPGPGIITERDLVRSLGKGEDPDSEHISEHLPRRRPSPTSTGTSTRPPRRWPSAASATWSSSGAASCAGSSRCATSCACGARAPGRSPDRVAAARGRRRPATARQRGRGTFRRALLGRGRRCGRRLARGARVAAAAAVLAGRDRRAALAARARLRFAVDAWHLPLPVSATDEDAARELGEALAAAHGAEAQVRSFEHRGVERTTCRWPTASPEEHVAAALRTLVAGHQRGVTSAAGGRSALGVDLAGGRGALGRARRARPSGQGSDVWREPLTRRRMRGAPRPNCYGASVRSRPSPRRSSSSCSTTTSSVRA